MLPPQESPQPAGNLPEISVGELSQRLKRTVEEAFSLVRVRGEISGCKRHTSGHIYLCLKDQDAVIDGVIWRASVPRLGVAPEDGLDVVVTGRLTTYPGRSKYQIVIERLELAGVGALMAALEARKKKLMAEGLFDAARKRPLPRLPAVIGVVTSPTGAVIRDILHRLRDRFPRPVLVWPVAVQGEGAAEQIAAAINGFNSLDVNGTVPRPDLLIVARGGGSLEDLLAFNEEIVVRAAAASTIPLISAVGHETDTTLIDFAADRRAPTPTAAAEMAVPVRADLLSALDESQLRLAQAMRRGLSERRLHYQASARALRRPQDLLALARQKNDDMAERLPRALGARIATARARFERSLGGLRPRLLARELDSMRRALLQSAERIDLAYRRRLREARAQYSARAGLLETLSYHATLARGFALVLADGHPVTRAAQLAPGQTVRLMLHDGAREAVIDGTATQKKTKKPETEPRGGQGSLI